MAVSDSNNLTSEGLAVMHNTYQPKRHTNGEDAKPQAHLANNRTCRRKLGHANRGISKVIVNEL